MIWNDRLYFLSDRDGTMNLWSMALAGGGLTQHTRHADYEAQDASLSGGRIAYQHGADIRLYDIAANTDRVVPIRLVSDFDHVRERWVTTPLDWVTAAHLSPTGDRVVLTARGQLFVVPAEQGRLVEATRNPKVALPQRPVHARRQVAARRCRMNPARWSSGACPPTASGRRRR